jgi:hypothetical protein
VAVVAQTSGLAIASLVLALFALCGVGSIGAIVCGHLAIARIKTSNGTLKGRGLATAGLILGYVELVGLAVYLIVLLISSSHLGGTSALRSGGI